MTPAAQAVIIKKRQMTEGPSLPSIDPSQLLQEISSVITIPAYFTPFEQVWTDSSYQLKQSSILNQRYGTITGQKVFSSLENLFNSVLLESSSILANTQQQETLTSTVVTTTTASADNSASSTTTIASTPTQNSNQNAAHTLTRKRLMVGIAALGSIAFTLLL